MSLRAVIVDDSAEFVRAARALLERAGITVVASASTGAEAVRSVDEHDPDVVLVDIGLGQESGFDVAVQLSRVTGRHGRVILISAQAEQDLEDLVHASPAIGFVSKSRFSAHAIIELLDDNGRDRADETRSD
jgi:DNA-binding NarL/FixJ family response regulator